MPVVFADPPPRRPSHTDLCLGEIADRAPRWARLQTYRTGNAARQAKCRLLRQLRAVGDTERFEVRVVGCELYARCQWPVRQA